MFEPHSARRIVLATNVAETSLTVPGIRYVIDAGTARVKRYSYRNKVEQLLVEPVSQAAANQRAGRCGRVSDGICIRLYDEADFAAAAALHRSGDHALVARRRDPADEVARPRRGRGLPVPRCRRRAGRSPTATSCWPSSARSTTPTRSPPIGRELARLPLDPRVGRMILEARNREALAEVLVIASALQRAGRARPAARAGRRPPTRRTAKFDDEKSEFLGALKLWKWLEAAAAGRATHRLSNRKQEQLLRDNFISPRRVREWRDIHSQLHTVVAEHGWRLNGTPATYEQIHLSMLAGLLGNIGLKSDEDEWYLGARGIRFYRHPGAHLSKKPGRWIVAAELVETTRLYGRGIAAIEPHWLPRHRRRT